MSIQATVYPAILHEVYKGCLIELYNPSAQEANKEVYAAIAQCGGIMCGRTLEPLGAHITEAVTFRNNIIMILGDFVSWAGRDALFPILDHEVGHIVHDHIQASKSLTLSIDEDNEIEADDYALQFHSPEVLHTAIKKCVTYSNIVVGGMTPAAAEAEPVPESVVKIRLERLEKMFA